MNDLFKTSCFTYSCPIPYSVLPYIFQQKTISEIIHVKAGHYRKLNLRLFISEWDRRNAMTFKASKTISLPWHILPLFFKGLNIFQLSPFMLKIQSLSCTWLSTLAHSYFIPIPYSKVNQHLNSFKRRVSRHLSFWNWPFFWPLILFPFAGAMPPPPPPPFFLAAAVVNK